MSIFTSVTNKSDSNNVLTYASYHKSIWASFRATGSRTAAEDITSASNIRKGLDLHGDVTTDHWQVLPSEIR